MQIGEKLYLVGAEEYGLSHPLDCNCYLIDGGDELALVDNGTGMGGDDIIQNIKSHGFHPEKVRHLLVTHVHLGHWGASAELKERCGGATVWAPEPWAYLMTELDKDHSITLNFQAERYPKDFKPVPCKPDETFGDGARVKVGDIEIEMIHTRGHTEDGMCMLFEIDGKRHLCSGDTVFYGGKIGLVNAPGCNLEQYRTDIRKLSDLGVDKLLPGHGVFVLRDGQTHIDRAIYKLSDMPLPETFFEQNQFLWATDYRKWMVY